MSRSWCPRSTGVTSGADDLAEPGADDGTAAADEQPEPEPHRPALIWTPTSAFDDSEVVDPDDPDFFRRLAAEIREDAAR